MIDEREMNKILKALESEIKTEQEGVEQGESLVRLQEIAAVYDGEDKVISSLEIAERLKNAPEEEKLLTGFEELDKIVGGFRLKQLVVISGIMKHGKTSFSLELSTKLKEYHPLWLPFEESAEELITKFVERGMEIPLFYVPGRMKANTLEWIEQKIVESKAKYGTKIVFIDHLGFITDVVDARRDENMAYKIERIVRTLRAIAAKWNVTIFLLMHLNQVRIDQNPTLEDLRGGAASGQEADTVLLVWRKTERLQGKIVISDETNVSIQANRRTGKTGNVRFSYEKGRFIETEWVAHQEAEETKVDNF